MRNLSKISVYEVAKIWDSEERKIGIENAKNVYETMESIGIEFENTPSGREKRNRVYRALNELQSIYLGDGIIFGGVKVEEGKPKVYFIARTIDEMYRIWRQVEDKRNNLGDKRSKMRLIAQTTVMERKLISDKEQRMIEEMIKSK